MASPGTDLAEDVGLDEARPVQTYQTTIRAKGVPDFRFVTIPISAFEREPEDVDDALGILGLSDGGEHFYPAQLPEKLWFCLTGGRNVLQDPREEWPDEDRRLFEFSEYLAFADLIPFESSEQKSRSGGALMLSGAGLGAAVGAGAAGAKVGMATGIVIGSAGGPVVILTAAAGFVVGGLVGAVTGALGDNIYDRLRGG